MLRSLSCEDALRAGEGRQRAKPGKGSAVQLLWPFFYAAVLVSRLLALVATSAHTVQSYRFRLQSLFTMNLFFQSVCVFIASLLFAEKP